MSKKNEISLLTARHSVFSQAQQYFLKLLQMNNRELNEHVQEMLEKNPFLSEEEDDEFFVKKHEQMHWTGESNKVEIFQTENLRSDDIEISQMIYQMTHLIINYDFDNFPTKIPDIIIEEKGNDNLESYVNDFGASKIVLNKELYRKSCKAVRCDADEIFIKTQFNSIKLLIKSINYRNFVLLKIMKEIAYRQSDFLLGKQEYMAPIDVKDVAISLMLHENIVRKAIEDKIVQTPRGVLFLKSMFQQKRNRQRNFFIRRTIPQ